MPKFWQIFKKFEEAAGEDLPPMTPFEPDDPTEGERVFLSNFDLRRGMWVTTKDGIGILVDVYRDTLKIQLVDAAGINKGPAEHYPPGAVKQASFEQIPGPRRPHPAQAKLLGYLP